MISQMELCGAIMEYLEKRGVNNTLPRQMNAIVKAANDICREFAEPYKPSVPGQGWMAWLRSDDTGRSSVYLCLVMAGNDARDFGFPHDPADFGRCVGLLDAEPSFRPRIARVMTDAEKYGKEWAALAANWDELEALYREELPSGEAPKLYARMKELCS